MQTLFNTYTGPKLGVSIDTSWRYIRSGLQRNIDQTVLYYRSRNFSVRNNHVLVRFLNSSDSSIEGDIETFYNKAQGKALRLASIFNFTTSLSKGDIFYGTFFGDNSKEFIMACDDYENPYTLEANWRDIEAVTFLDHPKSDTSLLLANGRSYSTEQGVSVIKVNVPSLLVQYRCWLKEQHESFLLGNVTETVAQFVHKYVLPNMLNSQLDVAIFNRINNLALGAPMGAPLFRHAFMLIDYNSKIDNALKTAIKHLRNKDLDFYSMMRYVPLVQKENLLEFSPLPRNAPTMQICIVELLSRIRLINFLIEVSPSNGRRQSRQELNLVKKDFDRIYSGDYLNLIQDKDLIRDIESMMISIRLHYMK